MPLLKLWSVRAFLAYLILWGLFLFPYTGLFLMFGMALAGPHLWGLIPHFIIWGLVVDIQTKKVSRLFWLIPILLYGGYYIFYLSEEVKIRSVEHKLKTGNPDFIIKFDAENYSLVSNDSGALGRYNKIAVTYDENTNFPEDYLSYRVASQDLCKQARSLGVENLYTFGFSWMEFKSISGRDYYFSPNACQIRSSEIPDKKVLKILINEDDKYSKKNRNKTIFKTTYDFYLAEKQIGRFVTGSVNHLPVFPFVLGGCGLNSGAASWDCIFNFYRKRKDLDVWPDSTNVDLYNRNPIAAMLQIEKYKEADLKSFSDYPDTEKYINYLSEKKGNERNNNGRPH